MKNGVGKWFLIVAMIFSAAVVSAQDDFGFGDSDFGFGDSDSGFGFSGAQASRFSVSIGGELKAGIKFFYDDFGSADSFKNIQPGDIISGKLNFEAGASSARGVINLDLTPVFDGSSPITIDEAYVQAFFGPVTIQGGLRKLSWGKADSFGPLDLINPLDYSDLSKLSSPQSIKIARPMIHASWAMGSFSKLEAVFVPWFQGHKFATTGRWAPGQITELRAGANQVLDGYALYFMTPPFAIPDMVMAINTIQKDFNDKFDSGDIYPETDTLQYAQAGMRFTTTIGSSDFGLQYYFGRLPRPVIVGYDPTGFFDPSIPLLGPPTVLNLNPDALFPDVNYNYYHHVGVDYAQVIFGFNIRAEAGMNLTKDLDGKDGTVENPAIIWSLGFDRDLFWSINLNLQGVGKIRLFHGEIGDNPLTDCEAGTKLSSTRITGIVSRKFLRDELELKVSALWGIEDNDFLIIPSVAWTKNDISAECAAGFFGGDRKGELGQYRDNSYIRLSLSYKF